MKKQYLLFIILLIFPIFISAETFTYSNRKLPFLSEEIGVEKLTDPYNYFYKVDEDRNILDNAEFIIKDVNGKLKYDVSYDNEFKAYKYKRDVEEDYNNILNILPQVQKNIILGFKKYNDIIPYVQNDSDDYFEQLKSNKYISAFCYNNSLGAEQLDQNNASLDIVDDVRYDSCTINTILTLFLEETKTPKGFEKEMSYITANVRLLYNFDQETGNISNVTPSINIVNLFKYDSQIDYSNYGEIFNIFSNEENASKYMYDNTACSIAEEPYDNPIRGTDSSTFNKYKVSYLEGTVNNYRINKISSANLNDENFIAKCFAPIIVDKKGSSALTVNSYVNSKEEVNLTESSNVEIKVFLKNTGKAPSYENKVVSNVPEGVEYVAGSATDNGVYDEEKNTVTWDLDYLDASSGYIFSYEVAVTTGSKESVYVTTSSVSSEDNTTPIVSNEAKVTTPGVGGDAPEEESDEITNPGTGDERTTILVMLLIVSIGIFYYSFTKRTFKL